MNEWNQKMRGIPQRRTCPLGDNRRPEIEINDRDGNVCFHKGEKRGGVKGVTMKIAHKEPAIS
jgi:hypothetical protein